MQHWRVPFKVCTIVTAYMCSRFTGRGQDHPAGNGGLERLDARTQRQLGSHPLPLARPLPTPLDLLERGTRGRQKSESRDQEGRVNADSSQAY